MERRREKGDGGRIKARREGKKKGREGEGKRRRREGGEGERDERRVGRDFSSRGTACRIMVSGTRGGEVEGCSARILTGISASRGKRGRGRGERKIERNGRF